MPAPLLCTRNLRKLCPFNNACHLTMGSETGSIQTVRVPSPSKMKPQISLYGKTIYPKELQNLSLSGIKSHFNLLEENSTETQFLSFY